VRLSSPSLSLFLLARLANSHPHFLYSCAGLVILEAMYGVLEAVDDKVQDEAELRWLDVTGALLFFPLGLVARSPSHPTSLNPLFPAVPLQALLPAGLSQLTIPAGRSKASLLGFYDAAIGEKKRLRVRYRFKGRVHEAVWRDRDAVALPMKAHLLEEEKGGRR